MLGPENSVCADITIWCRVSSWKYWVPSVLTLPPPSVVWSLSLKTIEAPLLYIFTNLLLDLSPPVPVGLLKRYAVCVASVILNLKEYETIFPEDVLSSYTVFVVTPSKLIGFPAVLVSTSTELLSFLIKLVFKLVNLLPSP